MRITVGMSWVLKKVMNCRTYFDNGAKIHDYENNGKFSISKCYKAIREPITQVRWKRLLCNNKASPKSLFITWLAVLNRLATKSRLAQWNMISDTTCVLRNDAEEDIQHLFFNCPFSSDIWMQCLNLLGISRRPMAFLDEISIAASKCRRKSNRNQLYGMLLQKQFTIFGFKGTIKCLKAITSSLIRQWI
ncbi:uncharacterized protein LOC125494715 [Beta vulgaris subsp. vulgaris]|uniref:uncharacterized protein LOC125494715 n=1 Tax=Beta vulgaris subsp. vulgaris TaxID=3555 RepID=UPI002036F982|nr:uncharacterized protein LOC125494715 [Beta vulgaris subsp. vulgaris]